MLATRTLQEIDKAIEVDGGARFRGLLKEAITEIGDAFDSTYDPKPRKHLGGSLIGRTCARELWYGFRWASYEKHPAQRQLLFNRGHLEEARFIAQLRLIPGLTSVHSQNGKQLRVGACDGHFGGSLDGVVWGCPDWPGAWILTEFKTHNSKSFAKLKKELVQKAKPEHYVQMQIYMGFAGLPAALYCAVCKDTDERHFEIVTFEREVFERYVDRAAKIVGATIPPPKIADSPAWFDCKFCSKLGVCHLDVPMEKNCRTCTRSRICGEGEWACSLTGKLLSPADQFTGCPDHLVI